MSHSQDWGEDWRVDCNLSVRHTPFCPEFSLGFTLELDAVSGVHNAVEDGIRQGWIGDAQVPIGNRHLA